MTDVNTLTELVEKKREIEKVLRKEAGEVFAQTAKEIFEKYPIVGEFGWKQYTPSFNDGDPCVFTKSDPYIITSADLESVEDLEELRCDDGSDEFLTFGDNKYKLFKQLYHRKKDKYVTGELNKYSNAESYELVENPEYDPTYGEPYAAIKQLTDLIDDQTAESVFGNHISVQATKDGVEIEEYDCGY